MSDVRALRGIGLLPLLLVLGGCAAGRGLMPSPSLYATAAEDPFVSVPAALRVATADVLYVTDRAPGRDKEGRLVYSHHRSRSLAFGSAVVGLGRDSTWESLVAASRSAERDRRLWLETGTITELGRFPDTPLPLAISEDELREAPESVQEWEQTSDLLATEIRRRLEAATRPEALVYIHGFNNSFDEAAWTTAELWHFLGRELVPIVYAWPAGRGAGPKGYAYDRESGEFTVFHLKQLLRLLAGIDELEAVHVVAHSRGTAVLVSALRELVIAARSAGLDPIDVYRISNLVIVASDMDLEVFSQRWVAERLGAGVGAVTLYTSSSDRAIGLARALFGSHARLGRLEADELSAEDLALLQRATGLTIVELAERSGLVGHTYFYDHPAASSDLILLLRYGCQPGSPDCRPLDHQLGNFWRIPPGYP